MKAIFQQVNLRYLTCEVLWSLKPWQFSSKLPSSVSLLWNVQTLKIIGPTKQIVAPSVIWSMLQLRHLLFDEVFLPDPPIDKLEQQDDHVLLPNLQTLSTVVNFSFTEEVCKIIPNTKRLRIWYDNFSREGQKKCYFNLGLLHKLQSLTCFFREAQKRGDLLQSLVFPSSLRKLFLYKSHLRWEDLNKFGLSLPHLEVLKLYQGAFVGPEWDCVEGVFPRLKFLEISCGDLIKWTEESSEIFPVLEQLHLKYLEKLERIPSSIEEIHTLRRLSVDSCNVSAAISATEILEEQLSLGNEDLTVKVT